MRILKSSFAKINITLRVTGVRDDGYHNIYSLFSRINALEKLDIRISNKNYDTVKTEGVLVKGENIISKALRIARESGLDIPYLDVSVIKTIPPGMGLGGGSGNAGAILDFIGVKLPADVISKIGADVPFFTENCKTAVVSGIGDIIDPVQELQINTAIIAPKWNCISKNAYKSLDMYWGPKGGYPLNEDGAKEELKRVYSRLSSKEFVGLLPNDFAPQLIEENAIYADFFNLFGSVGAIAWGISGSGACAFVLYAESRISSLLLDKIQTYSKFINKVIIP